MCQKMTRRQKVKKYMTDERLKRKIIEDNMKMKSAE